MGSLLWGRSTLWGIIIGSILLRMRISRTGERGAGQAVGRRSSRGQQGRSGLICDLYLLHLCFCICITLCVLLYLYFCYLQSGDEEAAKYIISLVISQ